MNKKDVALLAIAYAKGNGLSPVQLQKTLFLLQKKAPTLVGHDFYNFEPYNYGPFDPQIYSDAESLQEEGSVMIAARADQRWKNYALPARGAERATTLAQSLDSKARDYLQRLVKWVLSLDFNTLLRYIYAKYPKYRENSVFQG